MTRFLDFRLPMIFYIALVIADMAISYIGVTQFGMMEGSLIINFYGIELGVLLVFLLSLFIVLALWKLRNIRLFSTATLLAIWMLCLIESAVVINNIVLMN